VQIVQTIAQTIVQTIAVEYFFTFF